MELQPRCIKRRLKTSCDFINRNVSSDFAGAFVELGAFGGSFAVLLTKTFPFASVCANDISPVAVERAREKVGQCGNVKLCIQDFREISQTGLGTENHREVVVLILECLYYLGVGERQICVDRVRREFPKSLVFVSIPITGGDYFTETGLIDLFTSAKYSSRQFKVLNLRNDIPLIHPILEALVQHCFYLTSRAANQVVYLFVPEV